MVPVGGVHKNSLRGGLIGPVSARLTSQHCALIGVISQFHWQRIIDLAAKLACIVTGDSCHVAKSLKSSEGRCFYAGTGAAPTYITTHHLGRHANGKTLWWYTVLQKGARSNYTAKADPLYCQYEGFEPEPDMLFKHHIGLNQIDYLAGCGFEQGVHVVVSNPNTRT